jgi:CRP-like cAMP-binding protein
VSLPIVLQAGLLGVVAASGLLAGAATGLITKPSQRAVAATMAFGSGTLLAAMAFELCEQAFQKGGPFLLVLGFLAGGFLFVAAETAVDARGGFLRREGTRARFLQQKKAERDREILERLSRLELFRALPPAEAQAVVPYVEERRFSDGEVIFRKGDEGDALYLITQGEARVLDDGEELARLRSGAMFGEMALLTGEARNATLLGAGELHAYRIARNDFNHLLAHSPKLTDAVQRLVAERLQARAGKPDAQSPDTWRKVAEANLSRQLSALEERNLLKEHAGAGAPLAIYIGALVDGVPESIVIGATLVESSTPSLSFLIAVFLSNFPEAMSSATGMTRAGFSGARIMGMWTSLVLIAGLSAALGNAFLSSASPSVLAFAESFAAGGILALLANTMMPEAFELGGRGTAFGTIIGFLCAFLVAVMH